MKVDGQCHCGEITYEAEIDLQKVGICHCTDCQQLSASAFRTVAVALGDAFKVTKGTPKEYIKTAESGNPRVQGFCGNCGTALYATDPGDSPAAYSLRVGAMLQREQLSPRFECWRQSALEWVPELEGTKKFEQAPG